MNRNFMCNVVQKNLNNYIICQSEMLLRVSYSANLFVKILICSLPKRIEELYRR